MINLTIALNDYDYSLARELFREYAQSLDIDLRFQHFHEELEALSTIYSPKNKGGIILAYWDNALCGCIALRNISDDICEMKRLYVRQNHRGFGVGKQLICELITQAKTFSYKYMRLDTLPSMTSAIKLYRSLGFYEIAAYRYNPIASTLFMEKQLA